MEILIGLYMYVQEAGSSRAILLLSLWAVLFAADWVLMVRGVNRKSRKTRLRAYGLTACSLLAALAVFWYFHLYDTAPAGYAPGYYDPVWEELPAVFMGLVYGVTLFGFLCWGYLQRVREITEKF